MLIQLTIGSVQIWGLKMVCRMFDKGHKEGGMEYGVHVMHENNNEDTAAFSPCLLFVCLL
jgi:hypothetical protein